METKNNKLKVRTHYIDVYLGSVPKVIYSVFTQRIKKSGSASDHHNEVVVFDFTNNVPAESCSSLNLEVTRTNQENFISSHAPKDRASLEKAEKEGRMWMLDGDWLNNLGIFQDNGGAGGTPCCGRALAEFNAKKTAEKITNAICRIRDHELQIKRAHNGISENTQSRIVVRIFFSAVGSTGRGSVLKLLDGMIRKCAEEAGVDVKIVVCMLLRGNLPVTHMEKAAINELTLLKNLRPRVGGSYKNPLTGIVEQSPCDILQLSSNRNNEGNIMSLDRLLAHEGQLNYALQYTNAGNSLQERLPDIEGWGYDEYGDPECGFTQAITIFSKNSNREISYLGYKTSAILAQSCLAEPDPESTLEQRTALVRAMKIVETEDENLISKSVLYPEEFAENASERAVASFVDRIGNSTGLDRLILSHDALNLILNTDASIYESAMKQKAAKHVQEAIGVMEKHIEQLMKKPKGIGHTIHALQSAKTILDKSSDSFSEKINELQELISPLE